MIRFPSINAAPVLNLRGIVAILAVLAAWTASLFFEGYRDITYAPVSLLLLFAAGLTMIPACWGTLRLPVARAGWLLLVFWLFVTLSLMWTTVPFSSLVTWLVFISLPLCFFMFTMPDDSAPAAKGAALALIAGLGVLAAWAVIQIVFLPGKYGTRAHHPMVNANNLATLLNMGLLPVFAFLLNRPREKSLYYGALALAGLLLAGILATQSRGGFICLLAGAFFVVFTRRRSMTGQGKFLGFLLLAGVIIFAVMQFTAALPLGQRILTLLHPASDVNVAARIAIWRATAAMIAQHPWRGTGLGTFYFYFPAHRIPLIDNSSGSWAHNDPLQFWTELGIAGPFLFYAFLLGIAARTLRALRRAPDSPEHAPIAGLAAGLLAVALHSHIEFDFYIMPILITAGVWLALWFHLTAQALNDGDIVFLPFTMTSWQRPFVAVSLALVFGLIALLAVSSAAGQRYLIKAQNAIGHADMQGFLDNIARAEHASPGSFIDPQVQLAGFYIDLLARPDHSLSAEEQKQLFDNAQIMLDNAAHMNPVWSEIDRKRAKLYKMAGPVLAPDGARQELEFLKQAVMKNPMDFRARRELAESVIAQGRAQEAYLILAAGLQYPHPDDVTHDYKELMNQILPIAGLQYKYSAQPAAAAMPPPVIKAPPKKSSRPATKKTAP